MTCSARRTSSPCYILQRESNQQKASQLAHPSYQSRHQDGDGESTFSESTAPVQRVARTYFRPENRLVLTLLPTGKAGAQ